MTFEPSPINPSSKSDKSPVPHKRLCAQCAQSSVKSSCSWKDQPYFCCASPLIFHVSKISFPQGHSSCPKKPLRKWQNTEVPNKHPVHPPPPSFSLILPFPSHLVFAVNDGRGMWNPKSHRPARMMYGHLMSQWRRGGAFCAERVKTGGGGVIKGLLSSSHTRTTTNCQTVAYG